ncbi:MAG: hypothetical protein JSV63_03490 [Candidatus Aenigmatarchaeota archaeon]|nr:MAG: hypothetical protein JSV63_03490 [Candidatus Aenigmarchaeota archaeon]
MADKPPLKLKILFWVILGAFSSFFAEVFAGSDMFPFFHAWGVGVVFPLYMLHTLVLATIVFRLGKPKFYTLYLAGLIFGLYEAYMTKILWFPTWNPQPLSIGGVAVIEFIVLVMFWHAILAFVTPLFVGETLLTKSRTIANGLPRRLQSVFAKEGAFWYLAISAVFFGIFQSINSQSPLHSLASGVSTAAVLMALICIWRNLTSGRNYDMKSLLPGRKAFVILFIALIVMYVALGTVLRIEALPGIESQATIWLAYLIAAVLLYTSLKKSRKVNLDVPFRSGLKFSWKKIIILALLFTFASTISKLLLAGNSLLFVIIGWPVIVFAGIVIFILALKDTLFK